MVEILINPVPKPRQTRSDTWKKRPCVIRYRDFADKIRARCEEVNFKLPKIVVIKFYIAMPKSWSKKSKAMMNGNWHQQKPDIDNLIKSVLDALCEDDSFVCHVTALKKWAMNGKLVIY